MSDLEKLRDEWKEEIEAATRLQKLNTEIVAAELHDCPRESRKPWDKCKGCDLLSEMLAQQNNLKAGYGSDWAAIIAEVFS